MESLDFPVHLKIPDVWQQEAIRALQEGRDVVVDAPTGAGKTYIFELLLDSGFKRDAVFTVPTRALANDKLLEWRALGWKTGIATGDVAEQLDAPVVVATLETQTRRLFRGEGPGLLVVDEYQMLGDSSRGVNYELAIALAPAGTQLLLLSGSVANPGAVVEWLRRLGRDAVLVQHRERPVPLEEVNLDGLHGRVPEAVRGYWPRHLARALMAELGPVLVFAPRRNAAEALARKLSAALPVDEPLALTPEQRRLAGDALAKLVKNRIAYHHSGLSYQQRAGVIEPLAKAGQLRVVVATTGLGAGVNFSLRSVLVTDREYRVDHRCEMVRPDELLQMFGRAGRRGLDAKGHILTAPGKPRLNEGRPLQLKRTGPLEWTSLISVMHAATQEGNDPREAAVQLARRLFFGEARPRLGIEALLGADGAGEAGSAGSAGGRSLTAPASGSSTGDDPPGSPPPTPAKAALVVEILNSAGRWERRRAPFKTTLAEAWAYESGRWFPAVQSPAALQGVGRGNLCRLDPRVGASPGGADPGASGDPPPASYGRELALAVIAEDPARGELFLTRNLLRSLRALGPRRRFGRNGWTLERLESEVVPLLPELSGGGRFHSLVERRGLIAAQLDYSSAPVLATIDAEGKPLINPPRRETAPPALPSFAELLGGGAAPKTGAPPPGPAPSPARAWLDLGLIDARGRPTRRGLVFCAFSRGEGLAIAAALEDRSYAVEDLIFDLANLRAGHRFAEFESYSARLANTCLAAYGGARHPGYLEKGLPPGYGNGAAEIVAAVARDPGARARFTSRQELRLGDIERAGLEWRSLLNQVARAPDIDWDRWRELQAAARQTLGDGTTRPLFADLPPLAQHQRARYACTLSFR